MATRSIDLNVDIGEGFEHDAKLLRFASSANICCGEHAGSEELTREAIARCAELGIRIGAHPGYPDRASMGRKPIEAGQELPYFGSIFEQLNRFKSMAQPAYIKPHGAFYNDTSILLPEDWEFSQRKLPLASRYETGGVFLSLHPGLQSLMMLLRIHKLPLMGLDVTAHHVLAKRAGVNLIKEGFADRAYTKQGTLVPRGQPGAVLKSAAEVKRQISSIYPEVDSICLHGDTEDCLEFAEVVFATLTDAGIEIRP